MARKRLVFIEDSVDASIGGLEDNIKSSEGGGITLASNSTVNIRIN